MNKKIFFLTFVILAAVFFAAGFILFDQNPLTKTLISGNPIKTVQPVYNTTDAAILYTDDFNALNDTTALKARGYKVWYRGGGPQGLAATWFQGHSTVFPAYNGPSTGYVAANYQVVTGTNDIDSWLVLPYQPGGYLSGDTISFYSQAPLGSIYPDSVTISYSPAGDSIPEGSWVFVGKFKVNILGIWEKK